MRSGICCNTRSWDRQTFSKVGSLWDSLHTIRATHCNTLQHTATHCNTPQHTATHCNTPQDTATHRKTPRHTATHSYTLQHAATHCNTLQHTHIQWGAVYVATRVRATQVREIDILKRDHIRMYTYLHTYMGSYEVWLYTCINHFRASALCTRMYDLIAGNPPPRGVSYLLCSLIKNPEKENPPRSAWYKFFERGSLPTGSWLGI